PLGLHALDKSWWSFLLVWHCLLPMEKFKTEPFHLAPFCSSWQHSALCICLLFITIA
ncbi:MAG: hypothetical protein ACI8V8_000237, partial [Chitinophagales bacterium]